VADPVIEPERRQLLESPGALVVGTVDESRLPDATRGWGLEVLDDGAAVRVLLASNASATLANLRATGRIAVTATDIPTFESVQVKGRASSVEAPTAADRERFARFCDGVVKIVAEIDGTTEDMVARMIPVDVVACVVAVEEMFDQTPGPSAGTRLAPVGR
jgi:hypothetical protein